MVSEESRNLYLNNDPFDMPLEMEYVLDAMISNDVGFGSNSVGGSVVGNSKENIETSMVVSSNLRRAISTAIISLWDRFNLNTNEKLHILPCLQEIGMGVDAMTINDTTNNAPELSTFEIESQKLNHQKLAHFYKTRHLFLSLCLSLCVSVCVCVCVVSVSFPL